jgi:hypothetical protein
VEELILARSNLGSNINGGVGGRDARILGEAPSGATHQHHGMGAGRDRLAELVVGSQRLKQAISGA